MLAQRHALAAAAIDKLGVGPVSVKGEELGISVGIERRFVRFSVGCPQLPVRMVERNLFSIDPFPLVIANVFSPAIWK